MDRTFSFKFRDGRLNQKLLELVEFANISFHISSDGTIFYSPADQEFFENNIVAKIRDEVLSPWQIVSCPTDWADRYRDYMDSHSIQYAEELADGKLEFLIPRNRRPHSWKF